MSTHADELVNSYMLRKFRESRASLRDSAPREILKHLKGCPDAQLVHPKAVDDGYGFGPMTDPYDFVRFAATVECPHGSSAHYEFVEEHCTLAVLIESLERHELELEHEAFRKTLEPAKREALAALRNDPRQAYLLLNGLSYPSGTVQRHVPAGTVVTDLPVVSIPWLLEQGEVKGLCVGEQYDRAVPDPCDCRWCTYAALAEADHDWLKAHGWNPPKPLKKRVRR